MHFYGQNCNLSLQPAKGHIFDVNPICQLTLYFAADYSSAYVQPGHYLHTSFQLFVSDKLR